MKKLFFYGGLAFFCCALVVVMAGTSVAGTVSSEDFQGGATGWNDNKTENGGTYFTTFLGRWAGTGDTQGLYKTYALSGTQTQVTVSLNIYEIDSWDGEYFRIYVNNTVYKSFSFQHGRDDGPITGLTKIFPGDSGNGNYGFSSWPDQGYLFSFTVNTTATSFKLGFGSTLDQSIGDEAWGVDNIVITDNARVVPLPASLLLFAPGLAGLAAIRRRFAK